MLSVKQNFVIVKMMLISLKIGTTNALKDVF